MSTSPAPLTVIYRDEALIAIVKPPGMLVHRTALARGETVFVLQTLRDQIGQHVYPVHRLDRPTGGVLLFALDPATAAKLTEAFAAHRVRKRYLAVVRGWGPEAMTMDAPLREEDGVRPKAEMPAHTAVTHLRRLATTEIPVAIDRYPNSRYSLMEALPETGRRHQIRRHLARSGHPIINDAKHGKGIHNRYFRDRLNCPHLLLNAVGLTFEHPCARIELTLSAAPDADFAALLTRFGWQAYLTETACSRTSLPRDEAKTPTARDSVPADTITEEIS
ncbi:pseudouridine synthase [Salinicola rhizosphaerae]|uniref:tRNA pseudouridine(65) synthase TruC n=1 Tax=Salinicola rhizosphaerae TaxID=1443141 RepID=A0ABQ3E7X8_9GAMM|nr:pseudouridine synthase [Salinicola rhizosphaerae]GHB22265.1 tRNA pseudouridine(65) synthase TruC [Salinicola rhizosphaerae]